MVREMEGSTSGNTRLRGCCEARIQAVVDKDPTLIKDPMYTSEKPEAKTIEI